MTMTMALATTEKNKTNVLDCQVVGLSVTTGGKPVNGNLGTFKPWYELKYQGLLFYLDQDRQPGFVMSHFIPWFYLVNQGFLFN